MDEKFQLLARLENLMDQVEEIARSLADAIASLEVTEEPTEEYPEDPTDPVEEPVYSSYVRYSGSTQPSTNYIVDSDQDIIWVNSDDVVLNIQARVETINVMGVSGLSIIGNEEGLVGTIHVQKRSYNIKVEGLSMFGNKESGYAFNFNGGAEFVHLNALSITCDAYAIWANDCTDFIVENCVMETVDKGNGLDQATVRFVDCSSVSLAHCALISNLKHCFRIHGESSSFQLSWCEFSGEGNGVMLGGRGEAITGVVFDQCLFKAEGPDLLNVDENSVQNLSLLHCEFVLRHGWNPYEHVSNVVNGTFEDNTVTVI